jgi:hypothetical protein
MFFHVIILITSAYEIVQWIHLSYLSCALLSWILGLYRRSCARNINDNETATLKVRRPTAIKNKLTTVLWILGRDRAACTSGWKFWGANPGGEYIYIYPTPVQTGPGAHPASYATGTVSGGGKSSLVQQFNHAQIWITQETFVSRTSL